MLTVKLNPQQGLAPLRVTAQVHGAGPEDEQVCVITEGIDVCFSQRECAVFNSTFTVGFTLPEPGTYEFYATEGEDGPHSNHLRIEVK